jgi:hypothetical protein
MLTVAPVTLADERVRLEPLGLQHVEGLKRAAADGELWTIRVTSVPDPDDTRGYVERALQAFAEGHRLAFAVLDARSGEVIGSSSYHDIVPAVDGSRSATPGTPRAGSARTSTRAPSCSS